ncbi:MAG: hypothetical protein ABJB74_10490 [Gemmatimonas sp.]
MNAVSAKLKFGVSELMAPAFSALSGRVVADEAAAFVTSGRYSTDLGGVAANDPKFLQAVLKLRDSQEATSLRGQIRNLIATNEGADAILAVDGALKAAVPSAILQGAMEKFATLVAPSGSASMPAIWNEPADVSSAFPKWRARSIELMNAHVLKTGVSFHSTCPCGSGEFFRDCCSAALAEIIPTNS